MGATASKTPLHVCEITQVKESDRFYGRGIFTKVDIPADTILECPSGCSEKMIDYANDANFIFPQEWTLEHLRLVLDHYQTNYTASTSNVGVEMIPPEGLTTDNSQGKYTDLVPRYITLREIKAGEELTYRYGVPIWGFIIAHDLVAYDSEEPQKTPGFYFENDAAKRRALDNWSTVLQEFGHPLAFKMDEREEDR